MEKYFRGEKLINRKNEINFFLNWFAGLPKLILWVYGPKSSGKTTLIEYIVENELFEDFWNLKPRGNYWVKYMNLREYLISSYDSFIEAFVKPKPIKKRKEEKIDSIISVGIFRIHASKLDEIRDKKEDLFKVLAGELKVIAKEKKIVLIIDEIQTLQEIYINGDRELLKEFLNFCVRLTKELHIAHVVILSSNTVFIEKIYNDAKLKKTSNFYMIDHLDYEAVKEWLFDEGLKKDDIELVWDYLGGCIPDIQKMLFEIKNFDTLKEYLDKQAYSAYAQIVDFLARENSEEEEKYFIKISRQIVENGKFVITDSLPEKNKFIKVVDKWAEKEIFFFDPETLKITGNSRIYEKGMEKLLK